MKDKISEYQKMFSAESTLWWYRILHLLTYKTIMKFFSKKNISILDAGCGTGGLMLYLINHGYSNIQGFDFSMHAIQCAKNTNLEVEELDLLDFTEGRLNKKFDVIISNDTFNYLNYPYEQKLVLNNFYSNLNKNGIVIMNLAALDVFKGIHDIAVGLKMRFTVDMVTELVDSRKFLIKKLRFWPFMLSPLIYIIRRNQNSRIIKGKYSIISDNHIPSPPVNYLLYLLTRLELSLFNNYPFGSSLLVILKKYR